MKKRLKKICLWGLVILLMTVFFSEYILSNFRVDFNVTLSTSQDGQLQLYYYSGNSLKPFDEEHSMKIPFQASGDRQVFCFRVPQIGMQKIRLDVDGASELIFQGMASDFLWQSTAVPIPDSIISGFDHELLRETDGMRFHRTGEDPQLCFRDLRTENRALLPLSIGFAFFGTAVLYLLVFCIRKQSTIQKFAQHRFLFEELVKRDFKKKYKRTVLGMIWSLLNPLLMLMVMWLVFSKFFGQTTNHYIIYLFAGNVVFSFFNDSTSTGMNSLMSNASIFTKVAVPKYLFLFSQNITALINFGLTMIIFFLFVAYEGIPFTSRFVCLLVPVVCLVIFNIGVGLILSAMFVFFRDIEYLWGVFTMLLMYLSAIFYDINAYSPSVRYLFYLNPVYVYIRYIRKVVIEFIVPSLGFHLIAVGYAFAAFGIGCLIYKRNNHKFLYYV